MYSRFASSDCSSRYQTMPKVLHCVFFRVAKASSHWKKHFCFISLSFWRLFLWWCFTTVFLPPLFKGLCWLCLRKGVHLRLPSLFSLSHFYPSLLVFLSHAHWLAISRFQSVKVFLKSFFASSNLSSSHLAHCSTWFESVVMHCVFECFTCSSVRGGQDLFVCVNVCVCACALKCGGYECVSFVCVCVCVRELECVCGWMIIFLSSLSWGIWLLQSQSLRCSHFSHVKPFKAVVFLIVWF